MAIIPSQADMTTPVDLQPTIVPNDGQWHWPTCLTAHTWQGYFNLGMSPAVSVQFRINWTWTKKSNNETAIRLVHCDNGPANLVEMGRISSNNWKQGVNIWNAGFDLTNEFNKLVAAKQFKNIGWQIKGDGVSPIQMYIARLEMQFPDKT